MTADTDSTFRHTSGSNRRGAKAIKSRLGEFGVEIKISHAYEALATAHGFRSWPTMQAASDNDEGHFVVGDELLRPQTFAELGSKKTKPFKMPFSEARNHFEILGESHHDDRTKMLVRIATEGIRNGSGVLYIDTSGRNEVIRGIEESLATAGRSADLKILSFRADIPASSFYEPFAKADASAITALATGMFDRDFHQDDVWHRQADLLMEAVGHIACWRRMFGHPSDPATLEAYLTLPGLQAAISSGMPPEILSIIRRYIETLPGLVMGGSAENQPVAVIDRHGYVEMQLSRIFGSLSWMKGSMKPPGLTGYDSVHMDDVVRDRQVVVVQMSDFDHANDDLMHPARLLILDLHRAIGTRQNPSSKSPFVVCVDHFGFWKPHESDKILRDLSDRNVCAAIGSETPTNLACLKKATTIMLGRDTSRFTAVTPDRSLKATL